MRSHQGIKLSVTGLLICLVLAHVPLALLFHVYPVTSLALAVSVFLIGAGSAFLHSEGDYLYLYAAGYIVGAEVMWRIIGTAHELVYEFGKYSIMVILGIVILRRSRLQSHPILPVIFMLCLLPSILLWPGADFDLVRKRISGNLSGPLSLGVCALYFARMRLSWPVLKRLALVMLAPIVATAVLGAYNIIMLGDELYFGRGSNEEAAGGFGPNQVSNALALGAILIWLILPRLRSEGFWRLALLGILGGVIVQMLFTFSRGGAWTFSLVLLFTLPLVLKNSPERWQLGLAGMLFAAGFVFIVWPWLNDYTSGAAVARFSNMDTTSRWGLAVSELKLWLENPLLGVGPGIARERVVQYLGFELRAHVEYTRLLAEHGLFGLLALGILFLGAYQNYARAKSWEARCWVIAALIFAFAYMGQAATRTVAPGFIYGLTWAYLFPPNGPGSAGRRSHARALHHQ